jgi:hypothetical protein
LRAGHFWHEQKYRKRREIEPKAIQNGGPFFYKQTLKERGVDDVDFDNNRGV